MTLAPNSRFSSYIIIEQIGVGATGEVYRCQDPTHGRDVALKILFPETGVQDDETIAQFRQEAAIMSSLVHPNIPKFYESGFEKGVHFIVSEFLEGEPLRGPINSSELIKIAVQVAAGISAMHDEGITHNDLKRENLIRTSDGCVKIIDFGVAERFTTEMASDTNRMTRWRNQIRGDRNAFGLTLYELATGRVPFEAPEALRTLSDLLNNDLLPLPPETQVAVQDALKLSAAEVGRHAGLLLTAMSVALSLAGAPVPDLKV